MKKHSMLYASVICSLGALFYLYEFILQVSPSVITHEMMRDLHVDAAGLGLLASCYYYSYTCTQLPAGLLYDRYGPRALMTIAIVICAFGSLLFGCSDQISGIAAGRLLMGVGSAFAFIGSLILVARWFPPSYFAVLTGLVQLMSSVGAIVGQAPLAKGAHILGWKVEFQVLAVIGFILALLTWLVVRDRPEDASSALEQNHSINDARKKISFMQSVRYIFRKKQTWWIALYSFTSWAPIAVFAGLWCVPYLASRYHMTAHQVSLACAMIWIGVGLGSPFFGWMSDRIKNRCGIMMFCGFLGLLGLMIALYMPDLSYEWIFVALFLIGLGGSGQSLSFAILNDITHSEASGTAIGFNNMAVVIGGALIQPLVGYLLTLNWKGQMIDGAPFYGPEEYKYALWILPACYGLNMVVAKFFLKETHCKSIEGKFQI